MTELPDPAVSARYLQTRHMGLTHAEFKRSLPAALEGMSLRWQGTRVTVLDPPRRIEIRLGTQTVRRLGALSLPQTEVTLELYGYDEAARAGFLRRFELAFQRGGG